MSSRNTFPAERREQGNGGMVAVGILLLLALLGNFLGLGNTSDGGKPPEPEPVPPGYTGPIVVTIDARGYWASNRDTGYAIAFLGPLGPPGKSGHAASMVSMLPSPSDHGLLVNAGNAPHYAADGFIKAAEAVGWPVSVVHE